MLGNYKKLVDNGNKSGALSTSLSKGYDCVDHNISIAQTVWYWLSPTALDLIHSYLKSKNSKEFRTQRLIIASVEEIT